MYDLKIRENFDCFGKTKRGGCRVLARTTTKKDRDCTTCNFYKPVRDQELDQERVIKKLRKMGKGARLNVAEKYSVEGILTPEEKEELENEQ